MINWTLINWMAGWFVIGFVLGYKWSRRSHLRDLRKIKAMLEANQAEREAQKEVEEWLADD